MIWRAQELGIKFHVEHVEPRHGEEGAARLEVERRSRDVRVRLCVYRCRVFIGVVCLSVLALLTRSNRKEWGLISSGMVMVILIRVPA